jgi:CheY-like chemotaxis protein
MGMTPRLALTADEQPAFDPTESGTRVRMGAVTTRPSSPADLAGAPGLRSTMPPSNVTYDLSDGADLTSLDARLVLPERVFYERLDALARRMEMLTALLQAGGLSRTHGARAIQAALGSVAASAEEAHVSSLGSVARALKDAVAELVDNSSIDHGRALDVLVLDESEISRDFVALAVEAQGHIVRSAKSYDEFVGLLGERLPDLVVTEVAHGKTPPRQFCSVLADLLDGLPVRVVIFSALPELDAWKRVARANAAISKDLGLPALVAELGRLLARPTPAP